MAVDLCGPLPSGHHLLVVVDYFSRFIEVEVLTKIDSVRVIQKLKSMFVRFGFPLSMTADNGRQFISQEFRQFCEECGIDLISTIPYWPQQNGEVERQNRSLIKRLTISQSLGRNWQEDLYEYLLMYRSTPHSVTLKAPAELMFNRKMRDKLPCWAADEKVQDDLLRERDRTQKEKGKLYADRKRRAGPSDMVVGDHVLLKRQRVKNKLESIFEPTVYSVIKRSGPDVTVQAAGSLVQYRRNVAHIKKIPRSVSSSSGEEKEEAQSATTSAAAASTTSPAAMTPAATTESTASSAPTTNAGVNMSDQRREVRVRKTPARFDDYEM